MLRFFRNILINIKSVNILFQLCVHMDSRLVDQSEQYTVDYWSAINKVYFMFNMKI